MTARAERDENLFSIIFQPAARAEVGDLQASQLSYRIARITLAKRC